MKQPSLFDDAPPGDTRVERATREMRCERCTRPILPDTLITVRRGGPWHFTCHLKDRRQR